MGFGVLSKRRERFYLGFGIVLSFLINLARSPWWKTLHGNLGIRHIKGLLFVAYLLAWIQCVRPRVVVTFIDNDWQFGFLSRLYPAALFVAIQNGVRSEFNLRFDLPPASHPGSRISMPFLYCFGQCEVEAFPAYGHFVDKIIPVGSLRASWYRTNIAPKLNLPVIYDVLLVSQWERTIMKDGRYPEIAQSLNSLDELLATFMSVRQLRFAIALRGGGAEEKSYFFDRYGKDVTLIERNVEMMSSYMAADQAQVIIVLDSTIGREAYGWGKKVLFVNLTGYSMYRTPVDPTCYTEDGEYSKFEVKLARLIDEPYYEYLTRTRASREWLMGSSKHSGDWAHERIRSDLERHLLQAD